MIALFFDTETTGFKSSTFTPEIVQIAGILQNTETKRVMAELNVIITPKNAIPERVSDIHGITDEIAANFGMDNELIETIFTEMILAADVLVAHNIAFDVGIIEGIWPHAFEALKDKTIYCTMREATGIIKLPPGSYHGGYHGDFKPPKLIEAYRYFFDADFVGAHDAMADVRACRDVYFKLIEAPHEDQTIG